MFEKILEKILLNYFGKFISGLDKNNLHLGVWKGDVTIENVNLKPECVDMLGLPLKILFSNVGKLSLKIPWSKLSSSPVEICLEDIFILLSLKSEGEWNFDAV
jgi:vacuolar protein sorting-associated protein 13A/C